MGKKRIIALCAAGLLLASSLCGCGGEKTEEELMKQATVIENGFIKPTEYLANPVEDITKIGDPFVLLDDDGTYYMYVTGSSGSGHFRMYTSKDLSMWSAAGYAYTMTSSSYGTQKYWAPEVYKYNGMYYIVYSCANAKGKHAICIASSETAAGPFKDYLTTPLLSYNYSIIDASLLFDDDGKVYLYYSRDCSDNVYNGKNESHIYGVELKSDLTGTAGNAVMLTRPDTDWEYKSGNKTRWNEGPFVMKHDGKYYMFYSANCYSQFTYSVGYAVASSPLGEYVKSESNPILSGITDVVSGPGHCCVTTSPDGSEYYMVYHTHTDISKTSGDRTPNADKLIFMEDGSVVVNGPTVTRQPLPSGVRGKYTTLHGGYTVTSTYADAVGDVSLLSDGDTAQKLTSRGYYKFSGEGSIKIALDTPQKLGFIWIYAFPMSIQTPKSVDVLINGEYLISGVQFSENVRTPLFVKLVNLPAGTLVENITLKFTVPDVSDDGKMAITEIVLVADN